MPTPEQAEEYRRYEYDRMSPEKRAEIDNGNKELKDALSKSLIDMNKMGGLTKLPATQFVMDNINKPILVMDFDGVIHSYVSGWKGIDVIPDPPVEGAIQFLWMAVEKFTVMIYSTRNAEPSGIDAMKRWIRYWDFDYQHKLPDAMRRNDYLDNIIQFPTSKPIAFVGIDDRVITFCGKWPSIESLINFKPYNK